MRIKGVPVPANIMLISLNTAEIYKYNSRDFLENIEKVYIGASSKNNENFNTKITPEKFSYTSDIGNARLIEILREEKYTKIHINEDCILGWAEKFYREHPKAQKGDFIGDNEGLFPKAGEIRQPIYFNNYIIPYRGRSNNKFKYLMDCLNDKLRKKELGAFYTPIPYCRKAAELVREAIKLVPEGNDYIILDRCAGTGNLQSVLTNEELSHCVLSTYEYYEYKVLIERLGDKVRYIIPPSEDMITIDIGFNISQANAMSEGYVKNEYLQNIINNPKITIILFENPPYSDTSSSDFNNGSRSNKIVTERKLSFVATKFRENIHLLQEQRGANREISNLFIWSGFKYYMRQPTDSFILFSPVKYFKSVGLVNKTYKGGYLFNRQYFHASPSAISCIWWQNIEKEQREFDLEVLDIKLDLTQEELQERVNNGKLVYIKSINVKKVYKKISEYNDRRSFDTDEYDGIVAKRDGYEIANYQYRRGRTPIYNKNIIGYMEIMGYAVNQVNYNIIRVGEKTGLEQSFGFYLRSDNYIEKLPLFCAKLFPQKNWYERDVYFTTADKGNEYIKDREFLKSCLIYTCLSRYNKCLSFTGSDGRYYKNELCFDADTLANKYLETIELNEHDKVLIGLWNDILKEAKKTNEYKEDITYGVYQIEQELNTFYKNVRDDIIYNYPELNSKLTTLKSWLKTYYDNHIQPKLFEYELLK